MEVIILLDIDGVLCLDGRNLNRDLVANLNLVVSDGAGPSGTTIVFNTAWNRLPLETMKSLLAEAGFRYPECLVGQTNGCHGGGDPAREWLRDNNRVGTPYVMIDDSTNVGMSWGRLAHCNTGEGLTRAVVDKALSIIRRGIGCSKDEVQHLADNLRLENHRLSTRCPWLTFAKINSFINHNSALVASATGWEGFMREACLE